MRFRDLILFAKFAAYCIRHGLPTQLLNGERLKFLDVTYVASYDTSDLLFYQKQAALIAQWDKLGYQDKIKEKCKFLDSQVERAWGGQSVPDLKHKPLAVGKRHDLITQSGLNEFAQAIMHNVGLSFNFMATGDGTTDATLGDNDLEHEKARMSLDEFGAYKTATGSVLRYGSFFIPSHETHLVSEIGAFSAAVAGIMMNRALLSLDQRIQHTIFEDFYGVSLTISMSSV